MLRKQINFIADDIISIKWKSCEFGCWRYGYYTVKFKNLVCKNDEEYKYLCEIYDNLTTEEKKLDIRTSFIHGKVDMFPYHQEDVKSLSLTMNRDDIEYINEDLFAVPLPRIISKTV